MNKNYFDTISYEIDNINKCAFSAGIIIDDILYFVPKEMNYLCKYNLHTQECEQAIKIYYPDGCSFAYYKAATDGKDIWFIPAWHGKVARYSIKENEISYIDMPRYVEYKREFPFEDLMVCEESIWLFPRNGKGSFKIDKNALYIEKADAQPPSRVCLRKTECTDDRIIAIDSGICDTNDGERDFSDFFWLKTGERQWMVYPQAGEFYNIDEEYEIRKKYIFSGMKFSSATCDGKQALIAPYDSKSLIVILNEDGLETINIKSDEVILRECLMRESKKNNGMRFPWFYERTNRSLQLFLTLITNKS